MAAPPPAAGPLEGMEDRRRQAAQPANTRHLRKRGPEMGRCQQEILASCRLPDPPGIPAQHLLGPPRPEDPEPDLAAARPNGLTNRRMRTRMSGGVRGGGATPPPTRFPYTAGFGNADERDAVAILDFLPTTRRSGP